MAKKSELIKSTGVTRKVDQLGRVVIPKELRKVLNIEDNKDSLEIYVDGDKIILKKHTSGCSFCGKEGEFSVFKGKQICADCIKELKETEMF